MRKFKILKPMRVYNSRTDKILPIGKIITEGSFKRGRYESADSYNIVMDVATKEICTIDVSEDGEVEETTGQDNRYWEALARIVLELPEHMLPQSINWKEVTNPDQPWIKQLIEARLKGEL